MVRLFIVTLNEATKKEVNKMTYLALFSIATNFTLLYWFETPSNALKDDTAAFFSNNVPATR